MSSYAVVNPATGDKVKEYPEISDAELQDTIGKVDDAYWDWSQNSTLADRAALIRKVGELHVERRDALAEIIVREMGKPVEQALGEIDFCGDIYGYYADNAEEFLADEPIKLLAGEGTAIIRRASIGPLVGIMPWNFPYYQVARFAGPNLALGNTILLKPAPQCPESAAALQQIYEDAGFPEGAFETILATNDQIADVIADPRVRGVSLTGSERAGAAVAEIAGRNLKKVVLELGGSDPFILLGTDDLDEAIEAASDARLDNTGQSCNAAKRFIVADELYDEFVDGPHREDERSRDRRPDLGGHGDGPAVLDGRGRPPRRSSSTGPSPQGAEIVAGGDEERQLHREHRPDRHHQGQRRLPRGVLRPGGFGLQGRLGGRSDRTGQRHPVRPRFVRLHRTTPSRPRVSPTGSTRAWSTSTASARRRRTAVRRRQAFRLRPRARQVRNRRVRQQEADPRHQVARSQPERGSRPL